MDDAVLSYDRPSRLSTGATTGQVLGLGRATVPAGGVIPFLDGWVNRPGLVATLLLTVAAVARARYFQPAAGRLLDPILTSGDGRLRLESFSSCGGVHARADLLPEALRDARIEPGTTNVDLNPGVRDALARLDDHDELRLTVGATGLGVLTRDTEAFERRVPLPRRWVKGLGEAALAQDGMVPHVEAGAAMTRRLLAALPPAGPTAYALVTQGRELRFRRVTTGGEPVVAGPHRLRELRPLARHALGLTVWARPGTGPRPSAWQLDLPGARMWLVLSADIARGFSGEGQALEALTDPVAVAEAAALHPRLAWTARLDESTVAAATGTSPARLPALLAVLGGQGLVGRDAAERAWFRRDLPFAPDLIPRLQPRVRAAARIPAADLTVQPVPGGHEVFVRSGPIEHRVLLTGDDARCTCLWYARHRGSRGPCRHVLAARGLITPQNRD